MAYELEYDLLTELQMVEGESAPEYVNVVAREARLEIERLRAEHDAIDTLHHPVSSGKDDEVCNNCGCFWPCTTHSLLHPKEARRG